MQKIDEAIKKIRHTKAKEMEDFTSIEKDSLMEVYTIISRRIEENAKVINNHYKKDDGVLNFDFNFNEFVGLIGKNP